MIDFLSQRSAKPYIITPEPSILSRSKRFNELEYEWKRRRKSGFLLKRNNKNVNVISRTRQIKNSDNKIIERFKRDVDEDDFDDPGPDIPGADIKTNGHYRALQRFKREFDENFDGDDPKDNQGKEPEVRRFKRKLEDEDENSSPDALLSTILQTRHSSPSDESVQEHSEKEQDNSLRRFKRKALELDGMKEIGKARKSNQEERVEKMKTSFVPQSTSQSTTVSSTIIISQQQSGQSSKTTTSSTNLKLNFDYGKVSKDFGQ